MMRTNGNDDQLYHRLEPSGTATAILLPAEPSNHTYFLGRCVKTLRHQGFRPTEGVWSTHNISLGLLLVLVFVTATSERVLFKFMVQHALVDRLDRDYRFVLLQCLCVVHFVCSMGLTLWRVSRGNSSCMDSVRFPKWNFIVIAFLNFMHLTLSVIPAAGVPAPATVVLFQSVTPITMLLMIVFRGAKYTRIQIVGGILMTVGIIVNVAPLLITHNPDDPWTYVANAGDRFSPTAVGSNKHTISSMKRVLDPTTRRSFATESGSAKETIGNFGNPVTLPQQCENFGEECSVDVVLFVLAGLPAAIASVFQEVVLSRNPHSVTPELMDSWVLPIQLALGMLLTPMGEFVQSPLEPWRNVTDLGQNVRDGLQCIFEGEQSGIQIVSITDVDWCRPLLSFTVAFVLVTVILNQIVLRVVEMGAEKGLNTVLWLSIPFGWVTLASLTPDLQPKTAPIETLSGTTLSEAMSIEWTDVAALLLVLIGLWLYQHTQEPLTDACTPLYVDEDLVELERELRAQDPDQAQRPPSYESGNRATNSRAARSGSETTAVAATATVPSDLGHMSVRVEPTLDNVAANRRSNSIASEREVNSALENDSDQAAASQQSIEAVEMDSAASGDTAANGDWEMEEEG